MVRAVLERVKVQRLGQHVARAGRGDVGGERHGIGANVRVRRAELGQAGIAEARLLGEARVAILGPVDVQEDRPSAGREAAACAGLDEPAQRVAPTDELAHTRLDREAAPAAGSRRKEHLSPALEAQVTPLGVGKQVTRRVVCGCHRRAADPAAHLQVLEHLLDALIGEVAREAKARGLHYRLPHHEATLSATTAQTSINSRTSTYSAELCACATFPGP